MFEVIMWFLAIMVLFGLAFLAEWAYFKYLEFWEDFWQW